MSTYRILALRLGLAAGYPDCNDAVNLVFKEIGPTRGQLTMVLIPAADLLDELVGAQQIRATLAAELDEQQ